MNKSICIPVILMVLSLVLIGTSAEPQVKMETRLYDVLPTITERIYSFSEADDTQDPENMGWDGIDSRGNMEIWKECFSSLGVEWPKGSSIKWLPSIGKLLVRNTETNHRNLDAALDIMNVTPYQVEIEMKFIQYDKKDVETLAKKKTISAPLLLDLWRDGKGKLISSPVVTAQPGTEATVKGVTEYIYPTDFTIPVVAVQTNKDNDGKNVILAPNGAVEPSSFETREVGSILSVLPEVAPDGRLITLTLSPEIVFDPEWKNYGSELLDNKGKRVTPSMEQPFFRTHMLSTSISIYNGKTVMIGGGCPSSDGENIIYGFVRATLIDPEGNALENDPALIEENMSGD